MTINLSQLPAPEVIKPESVETILGDLISDFKGRIIGKEIYDDVDDINSHTRMIFETIAYRIYHTFAAINEGAKQCMLPYATGANLENLVALFNEARQPLTGDGNDKEADEILRDRALLKLDAPSTTGTAQSYRYHALKVGGSDLEDVMAYAKSGDKELGKSYISLLPARKFYEKNTDENKASIQDIYARIKAHLMRDDIRPITDHLTVALAERVDVVLAATITIPHGVDSSLIKDEILKRIVDYQNKIHRIGQNVTLSALHAVLHVKDYSNSGYSLNVLDVKVTKPEGLTPDKPIEIERHQFPFLSLDTRQDDPTFEAITFIAGDA